MIKSRKELFDAIYNGIAKHEGSVRIDKGVLQLDKWAIGDEKFLVTVLSKSWDYRFGKPVYADADRVEKLITL